jgi:S-DNA-T family DNA segregation ATPase FtsK/SpoIIIE
MEARYGLLKAAKCRNIIEYNEKFKSSESHQFLPHIVVVIDDIGSLLTIGDDVKNPIMRLVQLARATGIHIIAATHRPYQVSIAFANKFPVRIFFKTDSAFCNTGADMLTGHGDMILRDGNSYNRLQCGFVDNIEVERISKFVGKQRNCSEPYLLPVVPEGNAIE